MAFDMALRERAVGLLVPLGPVSARPMFGGCGLYLDGLIFALIIGDGLYLRTDAQNRAAFEAAGMRPLSYRTRHGVNTLPYHGLSPETMATGEGLRPWAESALAAARRVRAAKSRPGRRAKRPSAGEPAG